jgi:PAS domain S-box-containing protein
LAFSGTTRRKGHTGARETKRGDDAKRRRVELSEAILDTAPDPVVAIDCEGRVRYVNPACGALFERASDEVIGHHVSELMGNHHPDANAPDGVLRGHAELRLPSGETRWIAYSARRMDGSPIGGAVAYLRDETERRHNELRLSRQNDELEQTVRALAHDLRSPLVSVLGFSRLLREEFGAALGDRGSHFLERITEAGRTMESLIRDLLDFARIGHAGERRVLVDPREVLTQLRGELKPRLEHAGIELAVPEHPPLLCCDRTRLYQVFSNLLGNALDHMGPCEKPEIEVEVRETAEWHQIVVRDNGRGVAHTEQERIFEMFHSVANPGGRKGTGIGLAIVKKIAELHGGRAFVESTPGAGAAFYVLLPRS